MLADGFKNRYTTIPFAIYKDFNEKSSNLFAHYHKEVELIAVVKGAIDFYIDSSCYKMKAGEVLVIPPYCLHRSHLYEKTYHECICFDLSILWDDALRRDLEKGALTVNSHLDLSLPYTPMIYNSVRSAIMAYESRQKGWEMQVIGNLSVMFGKLYSESFFKPSGNVDTDQKFVKSTMTYIENHFGEQITSATIAETLYLNNSYFCRLFKKTFRCCFGEYLTSYRIEQAKMLLSTTDQSISDIAIKCGFNGFSYFSKTFKSATGLSPSKYRSSDKENAQQN